MEAQKIDTSGAVDVKEGDWLLKRGTFGFDAYGPVTKVTRLQVKAGSRWSDGSKTTISRSDILFVGTKDSVAELAHRLQSLNGDQNRREREQRIQFRKEIDATIAKAVRIARDSAEGV